jgi:uncharacterized membrane protein YoaK (UPF0700 family)
MTIIGSFLFAFNSGYINSVGSATVNGIGMGGTTGSTCNLGLNAAEENSEDFARIFTIVAAYTFGSFLSGLLTPSEVFSIRINYIPVLLMEICILILACVLEIYYENDKYLFFTFASMSLGCQSGMISLYSGNIIRTTAMTAATTDVMLLVGRWVKGDTKDLWKFGISVPLLIGFFLGATTGKAAYDVWGRFSIIFNVVFFSCVTLTYVYWVKLNYNPERLTDYMRSTHLERSSGKPSSIII